MGIVVAAAMLVFGLVFFALLGEDGETFGIGRIFLLFWMLVVIAIGGYNFYLLYNYDKVDVGTFSGDINMSAISFDEKLRKLDALHKENLISEEEYKLKRDEIMRREW